MRNDKSCKSCGDACSTVPLGLNIIAKGDPGKSAYEVWLEQPGNAGKTVTEFLDSLRGENADIEIVSEEFIKNLFSGGN